MTAEELYTGAIIEWSGNEGFIIPDMFDIDGVIYIAWIGGRNIHTWTCHAIANVDYAIAEGKFIVKDELEGWDD